MKWLNEFFFVKNFLFFNKNQISTTDIVWKCAAGGLFLESSNLIKF